MSTSWDDAARFLTALTGTDGWITPVTFQTFDDNGERKDRDLTRIPHGTLAECSAELERLTAPTPPEPPPQRITGPIVVDRHTDTDMHEEYAEAQLDALNSLIERVPVSTSNEYETYILSVIAQCVKAEMLAANSWRKVVSADAASAGRLMQRLQALEKTRGALIERMPSSLSARFDRAFDGHAFDARAELDAMATRSGDDVGGIGRIDDRRAVGEQDDIGLDCPRNGEMPLAPRRRFGERGRARVACGPAGGDAGVEDENVGGRLVHEAARNNRRVKRDGQGIE